MKLLRNLTAVLALTTSTCAFSAVQIKDLGFVKDMIEYMRAKGYPVIEQTNRKTIMGYEGTEYRTSVERSDAHLGDYRPIDETPYKYLFMCDTNRFVTTDEFYDDTIGSCLIGEGQGQFKGEWATQVELLARKYNITNITCRGNGSSKVCTATK